VNGSPCAQWIASAWLRREDVLSTVPSSLTKRNPEKQCRFFRHAIPALVRVTQTVNPRFRKSFKS